MRTVLLTFILIILLTFIQQTSSAGGKCQDCCTKCEAKCDDASSAKCKRCFKGRCKKCYKSCAKKCRTCTMKNCNCCSPFCPTSNSEPCSQACLNCLTYAACLNGICKEPCKCDAGEGSGTNSNETSALTAEPGCRFPPPPVTNGVRIWNGSKVVGSTAKYTCLGVQLETSTCQRTNLDWNPNFIPLSFCTVTATTVNNHLTARVSIVADFLPFPHPGPPNCPPVMPPQLPANSMGHVINAPPFCYFNRITANTANMNCGFVNVGNKVTIDIDQDVAGCYIS